MTTRTVPLAAAAVALALAAQIAAAAGPARVPATNGRSGAEVSIPERAIEVSPGVFSLGQATDPTTGEAVEGYAFVHKNAAAGRGGSAKGKPNPCYGYLASGAKWKVVEPWLINTANARGLGGAAVEALQGSAIAKWEDAADGSLGNAAGVDILGVGAATAATLSVETSAPDGLNEVYFAPVSSQGAIAVTTIWGVFGGPAANRKLVEWDQVYDDADFDWSTSGEAGKMDFESLATHELGHSVGMGDLYTAGCAEQTMYGYATEGETKKRTLESGDVAGVSGLY